MRNLWLSFSIFFHLSLSPFASAIPLSAVANHSPNGVAQPPQPIKQPSGAALPTGQIPHVQAASVPAGALNTNALNVPQQAAPAAVDSSAYEVKPGEHFPAVPAPYVPETHPISAETPIQNMPNAAGAGDSNLQPQMALQAGQTLENTEKVTETGLVPVSQPASQLSSNEAADPAVAVANLKRMNYNMQQAEQPGFAQQVIQPAPPLLANPQLSGAGQYQVWDDMQSTDQQMAPVRQNTGGKHPWNLPVPPPPPPPHYGNFDPNRPPTFAQHPMPLPAQFPPPPPPPLPPAFMPPPSTMFPPPFAGPPPPNPYGPPLSPPPLMGYPPPPSAIPPTFKPPTTTMPTKAPSWMQVLSKIDLNRADGLYTQEEIDLKKALYYAARAVEL
ncbi:proline-rich protein 36-like [Paramacrobiotus metropolitanus]|uniref:proline-rich protein 36-like n=1 Tax=Paramacrobiotus metropolitanus TaxID=2943436 RepID=UPI0024458507|nr:proline-rich protein 36-like [Paramacrobiotus metropolitanus]